MENTKIRLNKIAEFSPWAMTYFAHGVFWTSILPYNTGYIGLSRFWTGNIGDCVLIKVIFDNNFNCTNIKTITNGEDPRLFYYKNIPYASCIHPGNQSTKLNYKLINLETEKVIILDIPGNHTHWTHIGKNWMPLVKNDELFMVVRLDPSVLIFKCNIITGKCTWVENFTPDTIPIAVTEYRGGTPLIYNKELDFYFGIGHKTFNSDNGLHRPFLYTLSNDFNKFYINKETIDTEYAHTEESSVEDPSSIYMYNDKYYCSTNFLYWKWPPAYNKNVLINNAPAYGYGNGNLYEIIF